MQKFVVVVHFVFLNPQRLLNKNYCYDTLIAQKSFLTLILWILLCDLYAMTL